MTRFVRPSAALERSHASFVREMRDRNEGLVPWVIVDVGSDFEAYVARIEGYSQGLELPTGFVPSSTFWLLDEQDEIVAVSNLRHQLTDFLLSYGGHIGFGVRPSARRKGYATEILRRTLVEARALGITDVLVTCDKGNVGSARAIIRNGGRFSEEEYMEEHASLVQRYWISMKSTPSVAIRRARLSDVPAITEIYNEAILETTATFDIEPKTVADRHEWLEAHDDRHPVIVAETEGKVAGWAALTPWSDRAAYDDTAETAFYVHSAFRGRGIGRRLNRELVETARRLGFHTLIARMTEDSAVSIHLHEAAGFVRVGTLKEVGWKFGRFLDVHIMQKMLEDE